MKKKELKKLFKEVSGLFNESVNNNIDLKYRLAHATHSNAHYAKEAKKMSEEINALRETINIQQTAKLEKVSDGWGNASHYLQLSVQRDAIDKLTEENTRLKLQNEEKENMYRRISEMNSELSKQLDNIIRQKEEVQKRNEWQAEEIIRQVGRIKELEAQEIPTLARPSFHETPFGRVNNTGNPDEIHEKSISELGDDKHGVEPEQYIKTKSKFIYGEPADRPF